jgi:putative SOS response-associated peptidase YedK
MCGRFSLKANPGDLSRIYDVPLLGGVVPWAAYRWNIAPSQTVLTVREREGVREVVGMKWGLVPSWSKSPDDGPKPINARAETVATSPAFRAAFKRRRCVIPASAFYEWQKIEGEKRKQPFAIVPADAEVFSMAGVWESWGDELETCAIITTTPNAVMKPIHDRMPAILTRDEVDRWMDDGTAPADAHSLLNPFDAGSMRAYQVSTFVNSPKNDSEECLRPIAE